MAKFPPAAQYFLGGILCLLGLTACLPAELAAGDPTPATSQPVIISPTTVMPTAAPTAAPTPTDVPGCEPFPTPAAVLPVSVRTYSYRVLNQYPHDPSAFTQGLIFVDGRLYESTGTKRTPSSLRLVDIESGTVEQMIELDELFFGEGLALWEEKLIQLTWQNRRAFVYDRETFALLDTWEYESEGWGLTHDGRCLIMSDGSSSLTFRDPDTFAAVGSLEVMDQNGPVTLLNELEYIEGEVWANVWRTNRIVRIDPVTGVVVGDIDLTGLLDLAELNEPVDVLNGIAFDEENGRIFVTGKLWPTLFEIEIFPGEN